MRMHRLLPAVLILLAASGCALVPKDNVRLQEAHAANARLMVDSQVAALAPAEARRAAEALEAAQAASSSLQDPALVDHLAYVARQRAAIAVEVARRIAAERAAGGMRAVSGSAR